MLLIGSLLVSEVQTVASLASLVLLICLLSFFNRRLLLVVRRNRVRIDRHVQVVALGIVIGQYLHHGRLLQVV